VVPSVDADPELPGDGGVPADGGAPSEPDRDRSGGLVVVLSGGDALGPEVEAAAALMAEAYVVAADSGVEQAQAHGWPLHAAVGDFDSVDPDALARAEAEGVRVERHPAAKDATDLALALEHAVARRPERIVVVGGGGGRLDHLLGGLLALADGAWAPADISALVGPARVFVVRHHLAVAGRLGELLSLLAVGGPATGVTTQGLRYPLLGETLHPGSTRGVSNELVDHLAQVTVESGVLLAVLPGLDP
jgi:thiamine pyrophosphokinase